MRALLVVGLTVALGAACSGDDAPAGAPTTATTAETTTTVIPVTVTTGDGPDGDRGVEVSTTVAADARPTTTVPLSVPPTTAPPPAPTTTIEAAVGVPEEGFGENEGGVPIVLDETASLACAHAEFARDALAFGDPAGALAQLDSAADRAEPSAVGPLAELAPALREATTETAPALVEQVLGICVELGHQI